MSAESVFDQIRESLNGKPGQPMVLGVCKALAERYKKEVWVFRLTVIVMTLLWTLPALAAYIILGFVLSETEDRTRKFFSGLAVVARESVQKLAESLRNMFQQTNSGGSNGARF